MRKLSVLRRGLASCSGIFAYSLFGLLFASIGNVVQGAFVVGIGRLLDACVVRTITANWWPSRLGRRLRSAAHRPVSPWPTVS